MVILTFLPQPFNSVKISQMSNKLKRGFAWPLVILIIALAAFIIKPWQTKPAETISVSAEGKTQVTPNIAKITASIESKNPNLDVARAENEQKVSTVVAKLKELGIEQKDIKTQNISAGPGGEIQIYPPRRPRSEERRVGEE